MRGFCLLWLASLPTSSSVSGSATDWGLGVWASAARAGHGTQSLEPFAKNILDCPQCPVPARLILSGPELWCSEARQLGGWLSSSSLMAISKKKHWLRWHSPYNKLVLCIIFVGSQDEHFSSLFSKFFPDQSSQHSPTRGQRRLRWPEPGCAGVSSLSGEEKMWHGDTVTTRREGHHTSPVGELRTQSLSVSVNSIQPTSNIHQAIWCGQQHWILFFVFEFVNI